MTNAQIADNFELVADLLEFQGANPFRIRAYRSGARTIRHLDASVASQLADGHDLTEIKGIGKDLAAKCATLVESGELPMLQELKNKVPESVLALLRIPGQWREMAVPASRPLPFRLTVPGVFPWPV